MYIVTSAYAYDNEITMMEPKFFKSYPEAADYIRTELRKSGFRLECNDFDKEDYIYPGDGDSYAFFDKMNCVAEMDLLGEATSFKIDKVKISMEVM